MWTRRVGRSGPPSQCFGRAGAECSWTMQNVGEVTRPETPSAAASRWVKVVLPAPRSAARQTTAPDFSSSASFAASAHVSSTLWTSKDPVMSQLLEGHFDIISAESRRMRHSDQVARKLRGGRAQDDADGLRLRNSAEELELVVEGVKIGAGNRPVPKRLQKRALVDGVAASDVDHAAARIELREQLRVQDVVRSRVRRQRHHQPVGLLELRIEGRSRDSEMAGVAEDLHAEGLELRADRPADPSVPEDHRPGSRDGVALVAHPRPRPAVGLRKKESARPREDESCDGLGHDRTVESAKMKRHALRDLARDELAAGARRREDLQLRRLRKPLLPEIPDDRMRRGRELSQELGLVPRADHPATRRNEGLQTAKRLRVDAEALLGPFQPDEVDVHSSIVPL